MSKPDDRFNRYRIMWIFVMFDLPTYTKRERKAAADFRKKLLKNGFKLLQFSVYIRHQMSKENAEVHINYVKDNLPPDGKVEILMVTDRQFGLMERFYGRKPHRGPEQDESEQLMLF